MKHRSLLFLLYSVSVQRNSLFQWCFSRNCDFLKNSLDFYAEGVNKDYTFILEFCQLKKQRNKRECLVCPSSQYIERNGEIEILLCPLRRVEISQILVEVEGYLVCVSLDDCLYKLFIRP